MTEKITILIAEDHSLVREAWAYMLNNDPRFRVIAETADGNEAIELSRQLKPDVVILDINLKGKSGINAVSQREVEVIEEIKKGHSSKEIAETLHISKKTIEVHRYNIMRKLNLRNVASLVNYVNHSQLDLDERFAV